MTTECAVGFILTTVIGIALFTLWWGTDTDTRNQHDRIVALEAQQARSKATIEALLDQIADLQTDTQGPTTQPIPVQRPDTAPAPQIHVAGGARLAPKPTPRRRHAA
jgi:hypothetical protein